MLRASHFESPYNAVASSSMSNLRSLMKDSEGLIPAQPEFYFVVDCPSLHIVPGSNIGPRRQFSNDTGFSTFDYAFLCPQCREVITRTRQIPTTSSMPSPDLNSPVNKIGLDDTSWPHRPYIPPRAGFMSTDIAPSIRESVSIATVSKSKQGGFFSRLIGSSRANKPQTPSQPRKKVLTPDNASSTLPRCLSFCFSLCGKNLILWKKDSQALVHIEVESRGSRLLDLTDMLPPSDTTPTVNIRFVAEGNDWICVLLSHNRRLLLLVLHSSGLREECTVYVIEEQVDPRGLVISPDNNFIAIGFGSRVHLFNYRGCHQQWHTILAVPSFTSPVEAKFQVLNFSSDNTSLVVATQRDDISRSADDDTISTYVWRCTRQLLPPQEMGACKIATPAEGKGLTSIYHSPTLSIALILGASPTPYPLFLSSSTNSPPLPIPHNMTEFRIRCACLSPPPNTNLVYMIDFKNKVFKIDLRTRSVVLIADLNLERGQLTPREEVAAMGVTAEGKVRLFWRQGGGLWICTLGGEVGEIGKKEKKNLRGVWEDAGGGG